MKREFTQSFYKSAGAYACYALCLIDVAEQYLGVTLSKDTSLECCIKYEYIYFNKKNYDDPDNFFVKRPEKVLECLTGKRWTVTKQDASYKPKPDEFAIEFWSYNDGKTGHFARTKNGFNSLQYSKSVREGKIVSYRICKVVA